MPRRVVHLLRTFFLVFCFCNLAISSPFAATISGTVYESDGTTPLTSDGWVYVYSGSCDNLEWVSFFDNFSANNGTYSVQGLPAGTYYVQAFSDGSISSEYWADPSSVPDCSQAQTITVAAGETKTGVNFQLDPGAAISGTVYESDGTSPLTSDGWVEVYSGSCDNLESVGYGWFDADDGTYSAQGLPAGTYYVQADSGGNHFDEYWADPSSVTDCSQAQTITVAAGETKTGVNFQLDPGAAISGTVYESDGTTPLTSDGWVDVYSGSCDNLEYAGGGWFDADDGTYSVQGLPAGTYYVRTYSYGNYINEYWADPSSVTDCSQAQTITVAAGKTKTGVNFQLDPGAAISGTVYEGDGTTPLTSDGWVDVYSGSCDNLEYAGGGWFDANDGTYSAQGLPSGTYYVQADSNGNHFSEYWADPSSVSDCSQAQIITVASGETKTGVNFQLDLGAAISGTVYESDGTTPLTSDGWVDVYSGFCDNLEWAGYGWFDANDGTYSVQGLPSGTYYVQAGTNGNYIHEYWADPSSVPDCSQAETITVASGETKTGVNFQLDPGATISGTVYESDGTTPLTSEGWVEVYSGSCDNLEWAGYYGWFSAADGTYSVQGLPSGTYYVQAGTYYGTHLDEYWAASSSTRDCSQAQTVTVNEQENKTGIDFQLDPKSSGRTLFPIRSKNGQIMIISM